MDEESKKIILARRARFVAAALASVGILGQACGGESNSNPNDPNELSGTGGQSVAGRPGVGGTGTGGAPQPCLSPPLAGNQGYSGSIGVGGAVIIVAGAGVGGTPQVCLGATLGGSGGTSPEAGGAGRAAGAGGVPQPCLSAPLGGSGGLGGLGGAGGAGGDFEPCLSGASGVPDAGAGGEGNNL